MNNKHEGRILNKHHHIKLYSQNGRLIDEWESYDDEIKYDDGVFIFSTNLGHTKITISGTVVIEETELL
jgi:hypothetical protein